MAGPPTTTGVDGTARRRHGARPRGPDATPVGGSGARSLEGRSRGLPRRPRQDNDDNTTGEFTEDDNVQKPPLKSTRVTKNKATTTAKDTTSTKTPVEDKGQQEAGPETPPTERPNVNAEDASFTPVESNDSANEALQGMVSQGSDDDEPELDLQPSPPPETNSNRPTTNF